jgi:hypothetical protein
VLNVMRYLEMIPVRAGRRQPPEPFLAESSTWVRAPSSGFLINRTGLGSYVEEGQPLGTVADPFGEGESTVASTADGVVIGHNRLPLVNEGDALWHVARGARSDRVLDHIERSRRNDWRAQPL